MEILGTPTPEPVGSSGLAIRAPGRTGTAESIATQASVTRAGRRDHILDAASAMGDTELGIVGRLEIDIKPASIQLPPAAPGETRGDETPTPPAVVVDKRDDATAYAVHYFDDNTGTDMWVFPQDATQPSLIFELPEPPPPPPSQQPGGTRAFVTAAMRGLVTVVAWVTNPIVGAGVNVIAKMWENRRRPYGLHQVTERGQMVEPDWAKFSGDPVLLLVHGTFSTPDAGFFGWLGTPSFGEIHKRYGGRCLALAHPTMHADPAENVAWFIDQLPKDKRWAFDTVSHSRGGLVVRELAARAKADGSCQVNRMVMVASPNFGTPLANAGHWTTFLNVHTSILTYAPDTVATVVSEGLLCLVKILGSAAIYGLPGIGSMNSGASYLQLLAPRAYSNPDGLYAIASSYTPSRPEIVKLLVAKAADAVVDDFFEGPNDMVVPTKGCSEGSLVAMGFPITPERLIRLGGEVHHCNFFEQKAVHDKLAEWLVGSAERSPASQAGAISS
jgi:pimeloyl-ACP methyl ester carboxylesterase